MKLEPVDPALVRALESPTAYPGDPGASRIVHLQTHLSHVFLTASRVYKLHKAARFPFVDFGARRDRNFDALRELRLNRRLAASVYLGVAAVGPDGRVGAIREALSGDDDDRLH